MSKRKKTLYRHIFFCFHGLGGTSKDFRCIGNSLKRLFNVCIESPDSLLDPVILLFSSSYEATESHNDIDLMGKRCALEFIDFFHYNIEKINEDERFFFSIIGHSLGGLVARNMLKWLFYDIPEGVDIVKDYLIPCSFFTMNCPHLGARYPGSGKHLKLLYKSFVKYGKKLIAENFVGDAGKQMMLKDKKKEYSECLLYKMCETDSKYMKALKKFKFKTLLGSTRNDHLVSCCSATIRSHNPFLQPKHKKETSVCNIKAYSGFGNLEEQLLKIIKYLCKESINEEEDMEKCLGTRFNPHDGKTQKCGWQRDNIRRSKFDKQMLRNLQTIEWKRIYLEFQVPKAINNINIHTFCLGSWSNGKKEIMYPAAADSVKIIIHCILMYHKDFNKFHLRKRMKKRFGRNKNE